jgi:raffinose/stachyose/melibiose transport system permease protein
VLAIPGIVLMLVLRFLPAVGSAGYAFTDWNGLTLSANSVGLDNFGRIFSRGGGLGALANTLILAGVLLVVANVGGLALALGLRGPLKTRNLLRAMFFIPFALSHLATGYIWQFIFSYKGPFNQILDGLGLDSLQKAWTADPQWALYTIALVICWQYTGLTMIIYLAGLEGIPEELDDAVAVDGASRWMKFRRVTLPLLAPALTVACTLTLIWGLGAFDQVIALTGGGPSGATETLATMVWKNTFVFGEYGYGAALALVLALIVACMALAQMFLLRRREDKL